MRIVISKVLFATEYLRSIPDNFNLVIQLLRKVPPLSEEDFNASLRDQRNSAGSSSIDANGINAEDGDIANIAPEDDDDASDAIEEVQVHNVHLFGDDSDDDSEVQLVQDDGFDAHPNLIASNTQEFKVNKGLREVDSYDDIGNRIPIDGDGNCGYKAAITGLVMTGKSASV